MLKAITALINKINSNKAVYSTYGSQDRARMF